MSSLIIFFCHSYSSSGKKRNRVLLNSPELSSTLISMDSWCSHRFLKKATHCNYRLRESHSVFNHLMFHGREGTSNLWSVWIFLRRIRGIRELFIIKHLKFFSFQFRDSYFARVSYTLSAHISSPSNKLKFPSSVRGMAIFRTCDFSKGRKIYEMTEPFSFQM